MLSHNNFFFVLILFQVEENETNKKWMIMLRVCLCHNWLERRPHSFIGMGKVMNFVCAEGNNTRRVYWNMWARIEGSRQSPCGSPNSRPACPKLCAFLSLSLSHFVRRVICSDSCLKWAISLLLLTRHRDTFHYQIHFTMPIELYAAWRNSYLAQLHIITNWLNSYQIRPVSIVNKTKIVFKRSKCTLFYERDQAIVDVT